MEASLTLIFAALYLLKRKDMTKAKQVVLLTLLLSPLPLMHQYAIYLFLFAIVCLCIFCPRELKQSLQSAGLSLIISSFSIFAINWLLNISGLHSIISLITFLELLTIGIFLLAIPKVGKNPLYSRSIVRILSKLPLLILMLFILFISCIYLWYSGVVSFDFNSLNALGYVPIFMYPVKLGVLGIFAITSVYLFIVKSQYRSRTIAAIIATALLLIVFSIVMETVQLNYISTFTYNSNNQLGEIIRQNVLSFRAERMFNLFNIPLAMISAIAIGYFITASLKRKTDNKRLFLICGLFSLLLISGLSSTILGFTYYYDNVQNGAAKRCRTQYT